MFYHKIMWFYQDFKNENCVFFKSVLLHAKSFQMRNETPLQL